jgi:disulfide bond formation protein DsbB
MNAYLYQLVIATPILILHIVLALIVILMLVKKDRKIGRHFKKYGMTYALVAALAALIGSLGFSEAYAYAPCKLCWIQRIFHYPQVILFAVAMKYHDTRVWTYSIWLSVLGFIVAMYQILMQYNPNLTVAEVCSIIPAAPSCGEILTQSYGYITIPVMSATLFFALIILYYYHKKK